MFSKQDIEDMYNEIIPVPEGFELRSDWGCDIPADPDNIIAWVVIKQHESGCDTALWAWLEAK